MEIGREVYLIDAALVDITGEWLFWAREPDERLIASLFRMGQIEPALAAREDRGWALVTGYSRALALRGMNAPLAVIEFKGSDTDMGLAYMAANLERALTPGMKLKAARFFSIRMKKEQLRETVWPQIRINEDSEEWELLRKWLLLPQSFDDYLFKGLLPLSAGRPLAKYKDNELAALMPLIEVLEPPEDDALGMISRLYAAGRAGHDDAARLIEKLGLYGILESDMPREEKRSRVLSKIGDMPGE